MTLSEAKVALNTGVKISHRFFDNHEFIMKDSKGNLRDENGLILIETLFWQLRNNKYWQEDWNIYIPKT